MTEEMNSKENIVVEDVTETKTEECLEDTEVVEDQHNAEVEALTKQFLRLQADFDNFRKRTQTEKEQIGDFVKADVIGDLLGTLDNFDRAIETPVTEEQRPFLEGFKMVHQQLIEVLTKHGLKEIEALGKPFDPNVHQAVSNAPSEEYEDGIVNQVFQKGYFVGGRVVRPAMVIVTQN